MVIFSLKISTMVVFGSPKAIPGRDVKVEST